MSLLLSFGGCCIVKLLPTQFCAGLGTQRARTPQKEENVTTNNKKIKGNKKNMLAGSLVGLLAFGGAATALAPVASAQTDESPAIEAEHNHQSRSDRLADLVADGVITQEQADEITARFEQRAADREERRAERAAMLADLLETTTDDLMAAFADGLSIAEIATANEVDVQGVINSLVIDANARLDEKVAAGEIDEARAEEIRANIVDRVTARVNGERPEFGQRAGRRGHGHFGGPGAEGAGPEDAPARFAPPLSEAGQA